MSKPHDISQEIWDITREGLADATGIHPDFLKDNDIDVATMCWHISEAIMAQIEKDANIVEAANMWDGRREIADAIRSQAK